MCNSFLYVYPEIPLMSCDSLPIFDTYNLKGMCYDIKPVRKEEGKSYWKIPLCDDDATREK